MVFTNGIPSGKNRCKRMRFRQIETSAKAVPSTQYLLLSDFCGLLDQNIRYKGSDLTYFLFISPFI